MNNPTPTPVASPDLSAAEAWSELEELAFYEGLENGRSRSFQALRAGQKALLPQLRIGDPVQPSGQDCLVASIHLVSGRPAMCQATTDGARAMVNFGDGWCSCGLVKPEGLIYFEDLVSRRHGWIDGACRRMVQSG